MSVSHLLEKSEIFSSNYSFSKILIRCFLYTFFSHNFIAQRKNSGQFQVYFLIKLPTNFPSRKQKWRTRRSVRRVGNVKLITNIKFWKYFGTFQDHSHEICGTGRWITVISVLKRRRKSCDWLWLAETISGLKLNLNKSKFIFKIKYSKHNFRKILFN